ncbi:MAG: DUF445 family protein [Polyangiales bacterium]
MTECRGKVISVDMEVFRFIQENWIVLLIPPISALVGWITNVAAIKMMFYPINYVGIRPFGWQGIVPANALRLAKISNDLINTKLLSLEQLFESFDANMFSDKLGSVIDDITDQIVNDVANKHAKAMWDNAGDVMQGKVRAMVRAEVVDVCVKVAADMGNDITNILDLEKTVLDAIGKDRALMGRMFLEVGGKEFKFIEVSGLYFGFLFGVIQMFVWLIYPKWWILPLAGFIVGYATNWIAIKMIFRPQAPVKIGPFTIQGVFHKRQKEVAKAFADVVANDVLNADNIVASVNNSSGSVRMEQIVETRVGELIAKYEAHPMAAMLVPANQRVQLREEVLVQIKEEWPKPGGFFHTFAGTAVDLRGELDSRLSALDAEAYEGVLRPAFQQDEWKLIVAGAVLGLAAGIAQLVYLFGEVFEKLNA